MGQCVCKFVCTCLVVTAMDRMDDGQCSRFIHVHILSFAFTYSLYLFMILKGTAVKSANIWAAQSWKSIN